MISPRNENITNGTATGNLAVYEHGNYVKGKIGRAGREKSRSNSWSVLSIHNGRVFFFC